jgi:hypothetical protein
MRRRHSEALKWLAAWTPVLVALIGLADHAISSHVR